jgi:hypothetical protein
LESVVRVLKQDTLAQAGIDLQADVQQPFQYKQRKREGIDEKSV